MQNDAWVGVRMPSSLRAAVEEAARRERRTTADLVRLTLEERFGGGKAQKNAPSNGDEAA
jgi:hypothetical protein